MEDIEKKLKEQLEIYFNKKLQNFETTDFSKGCDNLVYLIKTKEESLIIRFPKKLKSERPSSHSPLHLQWCIEKCSKSKVKVPKKLFANETVYIEEYITGNDLSDVSKELKKSEILKIYQQIGTELKKIHSIKTKKFSYMSEIPGIGSRSNFYQHFEKDLIENATSVFKKNPEILNEIQLELISNLLEKYKNYLIGLSDPRLLHCDITNNNIRVEKLNDEFELKSIIDFSDCCSGDPLYDFGEIFEECGCDWEYISSLEIGYGKKFDSFEKEIIVFYGLSYAIWLEHKENLHYCLNYLK